MAINSKFLLTIYVNTTTVNAKFQLQGSGTGIFPNIVTGSNSRIILLTNSSSGNGGSPGDAFYYKSYNVIEIIRCLCPSEQNGIIYYISHVGSTRLV
jgi:hypothetical protein